MSRFVTAMISREGGRPRNQDRCNFLIQEGLGCWMVADGLGGHEGGEIAAELAVDAVLTAFRRRPSRDPDALREYLRMANRELVQRRSQSPELVRMASTAVLLLADSRQAVWAHIGDSRLYHFRDGALRHQTRDHSVPQALVEAGELDASALRGHPDRGSLRRTLGRADDPEPTLTERPRPLEDGDAFLLCSDGFWEFVLEVEMEIELSKAPDPEQWLDALSRRLLSRAVGEFDNYTAIGVFVGAAEMEGSQGRFES